MSEVTGLRECLAALDRIAPRAQAAAARGVRDAQRLVEREIKSEFTGAHSRKERTGSSPGSPPEVVTGTLRRSVTSFPVETSALGAKGKVAPTSIYARIQELGGDTGRGGRTHLPARPYVRPVLDKIGPEIQSIFERAWREI